MFCTHCDSKLDDQARFCPNCGTKVKKEEPPSQKISSELDDAPVQPTVKRKPVPIWFKILAGLAVIALIGVTAGILFTESLVDVVDNQLTALRAGDINKAYTSYSSKEFQAATSLDQFRDFIQSYPEFLNNQSANFTQRSIKDQMGSIKGQLTSNEHVQTPIEYKLIKEDGKWKILSIRLYPSRKAEKAQAAKDKVVFTTLINSQLNFIKNNEAANAYTQYASEEFKTTTSLQEFESFVKRYPILSQYTSISFQKPVVHKESTTMSTVLRGEDMIAYVKYHFVNENGSWKVLSMRILSSTEEVGTEHSPSAKTHNGP